MRRSVPPRPTSAPGLGSPRAGIGLQVSHWLVPDPSFGSPVAIGGGGRVMYAAYDQVGRTHAHMHTRTHTASPRAGSDWPGAAWCGCAAEALHVSGALAAQVPELLRAGRIVETMFAPAAAPGVAEQVPDEWAPFPCMISGHPPVHDEWESFRRPSRVCIPQAG